MKYPKFHGAFSKLGEEWIVPEDVSKYLEEFVRVMYGYVRETSINVVRTKILKKMVGENEAFTARSKVDLSRNSLFTRIQRSNHCLACYKRAASPMIERPKPFEDQGWEMSEEGYIEPLWLKGPVLVTTLVDITDCADIDGEVEDIDEMDVDWDGTSDDENDGYEWALKQENGFVSRRYFVLIFMLLLVFLLRCLFGI